ncbi:MAG: type I-D CRISPR-associated helicase Cas3' [Candidatus Thorarchaeota archaeon]|nr:type I-D CRISPR-associated helicase Cas3' [Candidatus Thorarchaeota archaeon]
MMEETFQTVVEGTFLEYSEERLESGRKLYKHQAETVTADADVVVLDAPTGAGKTLAALKRVLDKGVSAIFVYPTNSLVSDQVSSIGELLKEHLGRTVNIIGEGSNIPEAIKNTRKTNIDLFHFTGESLEVLAEAASTSKGSALDRLLTGTYIAGRTRILLTNPDTLYLVFIGKYSKAARIFEQLSTFQILVLDEFHLYMGPTLARILFMINVFRGSNENPLVELVFLSATHGDMLTLLGNTYPDLKLIQVDPLPSMPSDGYQIRYITRCRIRALGDILSDDEHAETVASDILSFYDRQHAGSFNVKVLGIFSSVSFAVRVANKLQERIMARGLNHNNVVYQLHGLIPRKARPELKEMKNAILVGTSAIEVGIDFDVPYLVMEAHDVSSFLQRFGRGGRHGDCETVLYIPRTLADRLISREEWSFSEFVEESHQALVELPSYAEFLCSKQVVPIVYSMALAASTKSPRRNRQREMYDYDTAVQFFTEIVESNKDLAIGNATLAETIDVDDSRRIASRIKSFAVKTMVKHGFLRGTMNNVLVKFPGPLIGQPSPVFAETDLFDVFKMKGHIEQASSYWSSIPARLKRRYTQDAIVFVVEDLGQPKYPRVVLTSDASVRRRTSVFREPECHLKYPDSHLAMLGQDLLSNRNVAFHWRSMNRRTDFRIPRLYVEEEPGGVVVGDWAFIAEYLLEKQTKEDKQL